jgi:hypothetical protein
MKVDEQSQEIMKQTLWLFEYSQAHLATGSLHLFYAENEQAAYTHVGDYLREAARRGEQLTFRYLKAFPSGFSIGYTRWAGAIHVYPDGTVVEGAYRQPIERVAYKGEAVEQEEDAEKGDRKACHGTECERP